MRSPWAMSVDRTKIWMLPLVSYVTEGDDKSMSVVAVVVSLSSALSAENLLTLLVNIPFKRMGGIHTISLSEVWRT